MLTTVRYRKMEMIIKELKEVSQELITLVITRGSRDGLYRELSP